MRLSRLSQHSLFKTFVRYKSDNFSKTTALFLNENPGAPLMINSFSGRGFRLNNKLSVIGPLVIFPRTVLSWNVQKPEDINEDSLSLFLMLEPKIDILVVGIGDQGSKINHKTLLFMKNKGLSMEMLPTEKACATYNFLVNEGRFVAAALIPPSSVQRTSTEKEKFADEVLN